MGIRIKKLKNYRPIALMDAVGKIFCMILNERLRESIEGNELLSDEQNGFRMNRRAMHLCNNAHSFALMHTLAQ